MVRKPKTSEIPMEEKVVSEVEQMIRKLKKEMEKEKQDRFYKVEEKD
jgi:transcription initiation factor IIE alpha subunit